MTGSKDHRSSDDLRVNLGSGGRPKDGYLNVDVNPNAPRTMVSEPHPEDLVLTDGYHGFEGIYGNRITATRPGNVWDRILLRYTEGWRLTAPRVVTGIGFSLFQGTGRKLV